MPIEVRREQALDAALTLIVRHGYGALTMEAIAREGNLAKPVLYNAYRGLGPLLQALLEREEKRALTTLAAALPPRTAASGSTHDGSDPMQTLVLWLRGVAQAIAANPGPWRLMLIPPAGTPQVVRRRVESGRALALTQARALTDALLDQHPELSVDRELFAHSVLAISEHAAQLLLRDSKQFPPERLVEFAAGFLRTLGLSKPDRPGA